MFPSELGFINLNFDFFKKSFGLRQEELWASSRRALDLIKKSLGFVKKSFGLRQEEPGASSRRAWASLIKVLALLH